MKKMNIVGLLIGFSLLAFMACEPIVEEQELKNVTDVEGVDLEVVSATEGGNNLTLKMNTHGVSGYWDYNLGRAYTDEVNIIYPIPGTATFSFTGTLGAEFFTKTIDVQIDELDHELDQDWYDLVSDNTVAGKTWVFDGTTGDGGLWWFMSPPNDPDSYMTAWWNAGGSGEMPPPDVDGKMHFDLDGAANFTYYSGPDADPEEGSFVLNVADQVLTISGSNVLGGDHEVGNPDGEYMIISLTEDELILYEPFNSWETGWTWVFRPE
ncbi:MAG: hypothetical protein R6U46_02685 [Marinilabilia sp.]